MKVAVLNDSHYGVSNDDEGFERHINRFHNDIFFPTIDRLDIRHIIHAGDVFDRRKYVNFRTANNFRIQFLNKIADRHVSRGLNIDWLVGNHDVFYKSTNDINCLEELVRGKLPDQCSRIFTDPCDVEVGEFPIAYFPWITASNHQSTLDLIQRSRADIAIGHFELKGFEVLRGIINEEGMDPKLLERFDLVLSGHYHFKSHSRGIHYLGNQYDLTWSDYGDQRGFHVLDLATRKLDFYPNPHTLHVKIFYDDEKNDYTVFDYTKYHDKKIKVIVTKRTNQYLWDQWLSNLHQASPIDVIIIDQIEQAIANETVVDIASDTMSIINQYVDDSDVTCDKPSLKKLIHEIYIEAQSSGE